MINLLHPDLRTHKSQRVIIEKYLILRKKHANLVDFPQIALITNHPCFSQITHPL